MAPEFEDMMDILLVCWWVLKQKTDGPRDLALEQPLLAAEWAPYMITGSVKPTHISLVVGTVPGVENDVKLHVCIARLSKNTSAGAVFRDDSSVLPSRIA